MDSDSWRKVTERVGCYQAGKNIKTTLLKTENTKLKEPSQPNEEIQLDINGPIEGPGPKRWLLVGVERFSKWLVASVVGSTSSKIAVKFMESYISTYGIPEKILTNQRTAFTGREFKNFCGRLNIDTDGTQNLHTRTGLVERTIGSIKQNIKTLLSTKLDQKSPFEEQSQF